MISREQLIDEIKARLAERLEVEDPQPYGPDIVVASDADDRVLVLQVGGPQFAITVTEGVLEVRA